MYGVQCTLYIVHNCACVSITLCVCKIIDMSILRDCYKMLQNRMIYYALLIVYQHSHSDFPGGSISCLQCTLYTSWYLKLKKHCVYYEHTKKHNSQAWLKKSMTIGMHRTSSSILTLCIRIQCIE